MPSSLTKISIPYAVMQISCLHQRFSYGYALLQISQNCSFLSEHFSSVFQEPHKHFEELLSNRTDKVHLKIIRKCLLSY